MMTDLLAYDPSSPSFLSWKVNRGRNAKQGSPAGGLDKGYYRVKVSRKMYQAHRIIWSLFHGEVPEGMEIDHKDNNPSNNHIDNLRLATRSENVRSRRKLKEGTSKYKGVSFFKPSQKWLVQIAVDGKKIHVGLFDDEESAALAYKEAANKHHKDFAKY